MFPIVLATAKVVIGSAMAVSAHHAAPAANTHVVHQGETLWGISAPQGHNWERLYLINRNKVKDPNLIYAGEKLRMSGPVPASTAAVLAPADPPKTDPFDGHHGACGDGDGDGLDMPCYLLHHTTAPVVRHTYSSVSSSGYVGTTSFEACVIARESGGNSQVMNSSGHYGLYQFSASTWAAYGGNPADFGRASPSEQRQVFLNAMAQGGQSNWSPYDGC